jgi:hypothetical protein
VILSCRFAALSPARDQRSVRHVTHVTLGRVVTLGVVFTESYSGRVARLQHDDSEAAMARTDSTHRPDESGVRRLLRRLVASDSELDAEGLQEASARAGAMPVDACKQGRQATVSGRLTSVVYTPRTNLPTLEAELFDGTGTVTLVWLGRRRIPGIEPGRSLSAEGRIAVRDDRKVIYNPRYTLEPSAS